MDVRQSREDFKHNHNHTTLQLNNFDWFMRADDDLYVKGDRLEEFLRSLDPAKAHFLGQAGLGNSAEYGQLALGPQDNYCMGGPGAIISRETLNLVAPHLQSCLRSLLTTHEDVELGRCIRYGLFTALLNTYILNTIRFYFWKQPHNRYTDHLLIYWKDTERILRRNSSGGSFNQLFIGSMK